MRRKPSEHGAVTPRAEFDRTLEALQRTFRPLETTAADTLAWFQQQPAERQAKLRSGLIPAREEEVLSKWKATSGKS
jgi:2'-hydroxyisoflavone reductase